MSLTLRNKICNLEKRITILENQEVTVSPEPEPEIEDFGDLTIDDSVRPNAGWNNQPLTGSMVFESDVIFCFTIGNSTANTATMLGLNTDPNLNANWNSIDFAAYILHLASGIQLRVYESGANQAAAGITVLNVGDEICLRRINTTITYEVNGAVVFTSSAVSTGDLFVDSSAYSNATYNGSLNLTGVTAQ